MFLQRDMNWRDTRHKEGGNGLPSLCTILVQKVSRRFDGSIKVKDIKGDEVLLTTELLTGRGPWPELPPEPRERASLNSLGQIQGQWNCWVLWVMQIVVSLVPSRWGCSFRWHRGMRCAIKKLIKSSAKLICKLVQKNKTLISLQPQLVGMEAEMLLLWRDLFPVFFPNLNKGMCIPC